MRLHLLAQVLSLTALALATGAHAQSGNATPAQIRYQQDLQICDGEPTADGRMRCKRDAQAEYNKALGLAASPPAVTPVAAAPVCGDCGRVIAVHEVEREGHAGALGTIAGGVLGAALGHQVGGGFGKSLATAAGAAGGVYAGRALEERANRAVVWVVSVRFPDGSTQDFDFPNNPGFRAGNTVRRMENSIALP
ncbi:glycine zipper 2TM domain-containing protein [Curvibacter sp. HBC28]|uniref:Glycine zipper 2TM domain-containing protein n=1 Tax=Curvibacter microcysteis TaxID=3026419 RepID=A0ABT5MGZ7_9BURK|nr:glycine zipper 2TM domain-containing protein [Curvibacter sp. HBC28]MDD0815177.1 glycine zipper 2TM domain-containing protein [Curvibacter sp. HBC28]